MSNYTSEEELNFGLFLARSVGISDNEAVDIIEGHINLKLPIPIILLPYVAKTVTAWKREPGFVNQRKDTAGYWYKLIWHVHLYHLMGDEVKDAADSVVKEFPMVYSGQMTDVDTLLRHYYDQKSDIIKANATEIYGSGSGFNEDYGEE